MIPSMMMGSVLAAGGNIVFGIEAQAIIAAMTTPPSFPRAVRINQLVSSLKSGGVWSKFDILYIFAAADEQAARINWKNPGTFDATAVNSPTFTVDEGFNGNGTTSEIDSGFNPSTAGGGFTQNSAHIGIWSLTDLAASSHPDMGTDNASANIYINSRAPANQAAFLVNTATNLLIPSTNSAAHFVGSRTGATTVAGYINGSVVTPDSGGTAASSALQSNTVRFARWRTNWGERTLAIGHAGPGLSAAEVAAMNSPFLVYLQAIGAA